MPSSSARPSATRSSPKPWFVCSRNARASSRRTRTSASPVVHLSPFSKKMIKIKMSTNPFPTKLPLHQEQGQRTPLRMAALLMLHLVLPPADLADLAAKARARTSLMRNLNWTSLRWMSLTRCPLPTPSSWASCVAGVFYRLPA